MRIRFTDNLMVATDRFNVILMERVMAKNRESGEMYERWGTSNHTWYFPTFKQLLDRLVEERIRCTDKVEDLVCVVEELRGMIAEIPEKVMRAVDESKRGVGREPKHNLRSQNPNPKMDVWKLPPCNYHGTKQRPTAPT